jgi:hypothetical protein
MGPGRYNHSKREERGLGLSHWLGAQKERRQEEILEAKKKKGARVNDDRNDEDSMWMTTRSQMFVHCCGRTASHAAAPLKLIRTPT